MAKKQYKKGKMGQSATVIHPNAAGIDIGATEVFVAVPDDRDTEHTRSFNTFTDDLQTLAQWLKECGIKTIAMESTGVYAKLSAPKAITASAHKIARIVYHLLKRRKSFDGTVFAEQDQEHTTRLKARLSFPAKALGFKLVLLESVQGVS
jgi:hypothetical protein